MFPLQVAATSGGGQRVELFPLHLFDFQLSGGFGSTTAQVTWYANTDGFMYTRTGQFGTITPRFPWLLKGAAAAYEFRFLVSSQSGNPGMSASPSPIDTWLSLANTRVFALTAFVLNPSFEFANVTATMQIRDAASQEILAEAAAIGTADIEF